jgi:hypothetical protein
MPKYSLFRRRERDSHQRKDVRNSATSTISEWKQRKRFFCPVHVPEIMYQYTVYFYDILEAGSTNTEFISRHSKDRIYE